MQIVCVSRGTYGGGKELAQKLAQNLGIPCLSREEVTDAATRSGIPVGKVEMAVMRPRPLSEQLAVERDRFKAFVAATLAEKALSGGVVYHGRTGHLALPGVSRVLRIRAIMDAERRTALTMQRLNVSRAQAVRYNESVDEDRHRWARQLYNVDWDDPAHYDVVVSLDHIGIANAASALVAMAQLPEFRPTPACKKTLEDVLLAARCRLAVGDEPRTRRVDVRVRANGQRVFATYPPRDAAVEHAIVEVLERVEGVEAVQCTMASTNILWIEERFYPDSPVLGQILEIAAKWNAAVELLRLCPHGAGAPGDDEPESEPVSNAAEDAGILEDESIERASRSDCSKTDSGMTDTMSRLLQAGRAGERRTVCGDAPELLQGLDRTASCSLVVVGNVYLDRAESVRKRMTRELGAQIAESLRVPVIATNELEEQYLFGARHWIRLVGLGLLTASVFVLLFREQTAVLEFFSSRQLGHRVVATGILAVVVPLYALVYGTFTQYLLRLLKFE